jgi:hypothetical protein
VCKTTSFNRSKPLFIPPRLCRALSAILLAQEFADQLELATGSSTLFTPYHTTSRTTHDHGRTVYRI